MIEPLEIDRVIDPLEGSSMSESVPKSSIIDRQMQRS